VAHAAWDKFDSLGQWAVFVLSALHSVNAFTCVLEDLLEQADRDRGKAEG
jgi:heme exporter protein D